MAQLLAQSKRLPAVLLVLGFAAVMLSLGATAATDSEPSTAPPEEGSEHYPDQIVDTQTAVVDLSALDDLDGLVEALAEKRVIFIGETHDRFEDHLNQLAIIRGLHERGKNLAVGMEFFQQPFQPHLDAYIGDALSEQELLRKTEYFDRWRFDYRLYRPILRYAKAHGIPLLALNVPREITDRVGDGGIASLTPEEAAQIPQEIARDDEDYEALLRSVFDMHPKAEGADFDHFLEVQLLWDEGMAERAARWLAANPDATLVVLAGAGHLEHGRGIPNRVIRRAPVSSAIVLSGRQRGLEPGMADYVLYPRSVELPGTGLMGVMLDTESPGDGIAVSGFSDQSGAQAAGMKEEDRIVGINGVPIDSYADIRIALMDSRPGQNMPVEVMRKALLGRKERLTFEVELH